MTTKPVGNHKKERHLHGCLSFLEHHFCFAKIRAADGGPFSAFPVYLVAAAGAGDVAMVLIHPLLLVSGDAAADGIPDLRHKAGVFRPALFQIAGKHTVQRQEHDNGGHEAHNAVCRRLSVPQEYVDDVQQQRRPDHGQAEAVDTVTAIHKTRKRVADALEKVHN